MNDRLPGTTYDNPIWYKSKWKIYTDDNPFGFAYVHDDYDPTPNNPGDGPSDHRAGYGKTVQECKDQIDEYLEEHPYD